MATPNYSYEKRQREIAKKRKAEEKRQKKATRTDGSPADGSDEPESRGPAGANGTDPSLDSTPATGR